MKGLMGAIAMVMIAFGTLAGAAEAPLPDLRGFGRVQTETTAPAEGVTAMRFLCETPEKAETVAGKFLLDLYAEPGVAFKDGVHATPGGAAFAVMRDGKATTIFAAGTRETLENLLSQPGAKEKLVEKAAVPEWMDHPFQWRFYGMGGLSAGPWMEAAKKAAGIDPSADRSLLDPREDVAFLKQLGVGFDLYVEQSNFDNSDGIAAAWLSSQIKMAADAGVPVGARFYLPAGGTQSYGWFARRFAWRMEQPAPWMQNGWLRYYNHMPHVSWFDPEMWGYTAAQAKKMVAKYRDGGKVKEWMHPAGELAHQPWYDWHSDYSPTAQKAWREYLAKHMTLSEAATAYHRPDRPFASWDEVPVPEFATFAGLDGMVLDLAGAWQTSADGNEWVDVQMPGNWDFLYLYGKNANEAMKDANAKTRRFRRRFAWSGDMAAKAAAAPGAPRKVWLYFFPMTTKGGNPNLGHEVSLNGGEPVKVGQWCALDVTDQLKEGENALDILLKGVSWNGRVFLSTEKPEMYPHMSEPRCRLWLLWHDWRRDAKAARCEEVFDAMRQAEPNAPIEFMAPGGFGQRRLDRIFRDWGAVAHFTGEGVWFYPWYKRYGKLYGYQGTSELAGPSKDLAALKTSTLRVFLAGLDMHKPVFATQTYSRNPEMRAWLLAHKEMLARQGTYDIDLAQPQVLIYRRSDNIQAGFPAPFPAVDETVKTTRTPWNYDFGRGSLQSLGQSFLYIDDNGLADGKMDGFKVMIDCGNEIIPEAEVERIGKWVEAGGVFVALPFTGRSTPLKADVWPLAVLAGTRATHTGAHLAIAAEGARLPTGEAKRRQYGDDMALEAVADGVETLVSYADGRAAVTARRLGKGMVVHVGSLYWRGSEDVKGIWNPQDETERSFLRELLAFCGHPQALVETDDRLVLAQPYRAHDGLSLVAVLCNFNWEIANAPSKETTVTLRPGRKPGRIVAYAGATPAPAPAQGGEAPKEAATANAAPGAETPAPEPPAAPAAPSTAKQITEVPFEWDEANGTATLRVALQPQEVAVLNVECHAPADALAYWWKNSAEQWHELKKPTRDFSQYSQGVWKDPAQDLKEGWRIGDGDAPAALDCLQFWGWPEGKGAVCRKTFDLDDANWLMGGGTVRLVIGAWFGNQWLTPGTIRLNGETLAKDTRANYLAFDATAKLKTQGNLLEVEFADGEKFTGMNGSIYLYHRAKPEKSIDLLKEEEGTKLARGEDGKDALLVNVPAEWQGKYRVRLYMEGERNVPKGVKVRDRFTRKHHHNFGNITDIDITTLLTFGAENRIDLGANSPAEQPDKTALKPLTVLRLDLYPEPNGKQ